MSTPPYYERPDGQWWDGQQWQPAPSPRTRQLAPASSEQFRTRQMLVGLATIGIAGGLVAFADVEVSNPVIWAMLAVAAYLMTGITLGDLVSQRREK